MDKTVDSYYLFGLEALQERLPALSREIEGVRAAEDIANAVIYVASQPEHVSVEQVVINPTVRRNYQADYERYVSDGHTNVILD